jgi:hypothetical protein
MNRNYPAEIEGEQLAIITTTERRDQARIHQEAITDEITREVLNEVDNGKLRHSNDKARELAIRERCRASGEWKNWGEIARRHETLRAEGQARLERLRGEFAESKLSRRERIVNLEAAIN